MKEAKSDLIKLEQNEIQVNENLEKSQGGVLTSLKKWGLGLVTATGVLTLFKAMMNSTEGSASTLRGFLGLLEGGIQGLFRTIVTGDWSNLIDNIVKTSKATRDLKLAQDELSNIEASNEVVEGIP